MCDASTRFTSHRAHKSSNDEHFRTFGKPILLHRYITRIRMDVYGSNEPTLKERKEKKTNQNKTQECTTTNEFWHSFYTVTYDTICREKKRLPTWERLFTYYNFLSFVQQLGIDLYRTKLSSENEITIDSKTAWYKYFLPVTRMKLRVFPSYRNKIIR